MKKIYPLAFIILFASCNTRLYYMGISSTPTSKVDVFVDASAIEKPYTIMGKGYQESSLVTKEKLQEQAIRKAREKGADAVLFQDYFLTSEGTHAYGLSIPDSSGRTITALPKNSTEAVLSSRINILFLKYR